MSGFGSRLRHCARRHLPARGGEETGAARAGAVSADFQAGSPILGGAALRHASGDSSRAGNCHAGLGRRPRAESRTERSWH